MFGCCMPFLVLPLFLLDIVQCFLMIGNITTCGRSFWRWWSAGTCTCFSQGSESVGWESHCTLLYICKCYKIVTSENLVDRTVKRRLMISTTLVLIPVFLFHVFVDELFYLEHTLIYCMVWLKYHIQIIHNCRPPKLVVSIFEVWWHLRKFWWVKQIICTENGFAFADFFAKQTKFYVIWTGPYASFWHKTVMRVSCQLKPLLVYTVLCQLTNWLLSTVLLTTFPICHKTTFIGQVFFYFGMDICV